jgi:hypothetical protein
LVVLLLNSEVEVRANKSRADWDFREKELLLLLVELAGFVVKLENDPFLSFGDDDDFIGMCL